MNFRIFVLFTIRTPIMTKTPHIVSTTATKSNFQVVNYIRCSYLFEWRFSLRPSIIKSDPFRVVKTPNPIVTMPMIRWKAPKMMTPVSKLKQKQFATRILPIFTYLKHNKTFINFKNFEKFRFNSWRKNNKMKSEKPLKM